MDDQNRATRELIRRLPRAGRDELRKLWLENFGRPAAPRLRRELMLPVLAYRIQERVYGGLDADSERRLKEVLASQTQKPVRRAEKRQPFTPGTRILREWKGQTHETIVTPAGFEYKGEIFQTLSPIAKRITGTHWSGPAFFGTKRGSR